jgi:hypothetical protein
MASPSMTFGCTALSVIGSMAASGCAITAVIDLSTKIEGQFQVAVTFGTVAATSGLKIEALRAVDQVASSTFDCRIAANTFFIPSTTSTSKRGSFALPTGVWALLTTNTDATNAVTNVSILYATVDGIS